MWLTVYRAWELNTNERMIAFYKRELQLSRIVDTAKKQKHYWTKWYRKTVKLDVPSKRRYVRLKALISDQYRKNHKKYNLLMLLWKMI